MPEPLTEKQIVDRTLDAVYRDIRLANQRGHLDMDDPQVRDVDAILMEGASMRIECTCTSDIECGEGDYAGCLYCRRADIYEPCPKEGTDA